MKLGIELKDLQQLDPDIEELGERLIRSRPLPAGTPPEEAIEFLAPRGRLVAALCDSLYATRYHQLQFLWRLGKVVARETFAVKPPRTSAEVRISDGPMRAELEAFLIRAVSTRDALVPLVCELLARSLKHDTLGKLIRHLEHDQSPSKPASIKLRALFRKHEGWIHQLRDLRNAIVHDGEFDGFRSVGHHHGQILDATVCGVRAGAFAISTWRGLRNLMTDTAGFVEEVYRPPPPQIEPSRDSERQHDATPPSTHGF
jgi:hypothetical protein